ncbi:MAG: hypothetical protein KF751_06230 [Nitrospira sp.]|nr:hypothetical protein [Nitrospira sp.]
MTTEIETPAPKLFFTYAHPRDPHLQQGDILAKTPELLEVIEQVHPYYKNNSYTHFIVLTQSCDLVRRDGTNPKSRYLTLAAIRPLSIVIERELQKYQSDLAKKAMVCKESLREKLTHFVGQLLNNNSGEFFYLHPQADLGFHEPSCAFLRLSVSIKSSMHYQTCYSARLLSLDQIFQSKLGWLVGNMYSRVGTDDWVPKENTEAQFAQTIRDILEGHCDFVDDKKLKAAERSSTPEILQKAKHEIREFIKKTQVPQKREEILRAVEEIVTDMGKIATPDEARQLKLRLSNHPKFKEFTK